MPDQYADLIERLGVAAMDAREAVREAHEARRDLREAVKEAKAEVDALMEARIADRIDLLVNTRLQEFGEVVSARQTEIFNKISTEANKLFDICLGKEGTEGDLRPLLSRAAERIALYEKLHEDDDRRRGKPRGSG